MSGIEGVCRPVSPGTDAGVLAVVVAIMVFVGLNVKHVRRLFRSIPQDLWSVRRRANVFDDHTAYETRTILLLLLQLFVVGGILLYMWIAGSVPASAGTPVGKCVGSLAALVGGYYIFQLAAYSVVGYVFTDSLRAVHWRRGLNASSVLLGFLLLIPALVSLFYPAYAGSMLILSAVLYILLRLVFIAKGFRIFYRKIPSLLYFILYLCALEIIPVIVLYHLATEICRTILVAA